MLTKDTARTYLPDVKRNLNITWDDEDTDARIVDMMLDAEYALNHLLGAEIDYFAPGMERSIYMSYILYAYNGCTNEFESAYLADIYRLRRMYEVKGANDEA